MSLTAAPHGVARDDAALAGRRPGRSAPASLAIAVLALVWALGIGSVRAESGTRAIGSPGGGQLDAELGALYESTGLNPFDAVGANNLAMKLVARGDYEKARKLLQRAGRLEPNRLEIARNAEQVQQLIDQRAELPERSRAHFRDSFARTEVPFVTAAWVVKGPGEIGAPERERDEATLAAAREEDGSDAAATLADNPFDTRWLRERAAIKVRRGDHRAALADLHRALELDPYLSGVAQEIERLKALLPENGERPMSLAPPLTASRVMSGRGERADDALPAPWSVPDALPGTDPKGWEPAR